MNNKPLEELLNAHASAKKKMILGIVFTAIAVFFATLGSIVVTAGASLSVMVVFLVLSLPFYGVGIPFLIKGIINTTKLNKQIVAARAELARGTAAQEAPAAQPEAKAEEPAAEAPAAEEPVAEGPAPKARFCTNCGRALTENEIFCPDCGTKAYSAAAEEPEAEEPKAAGFVDIDWKKYDPLDGGVSYDPNKDYKFHRAEGFMGSVPQTFVNRTFPKCPICCSKDPYWTIAQHNQMSWKGNLYLFKCSRCEGIISMSMPDVTTVGNGGAGFAANATVGLTNIIAKSSSGKEAGAVYAVIESVGNSGVTPECQGREFKLEQLQDMFDRM